MDFTDKVYLVLKNLSQQVGGKLSEIQWKTAHREEFKKTIKEMKKPLVGSMTDDEWVASLEAEPHLKGVNIRKEISACQFYCKNNKRMATRRMIINWLNKAERVFDLKALGAQHATGLKIPAPAGPYGWEKWLDTELSTISEDHSAYGQLIAAQRNNQFSMMPASWQVKCRAHLLSVGMNSVVAETEKELRLRQA